MIKVLTLINQPHLWLPPLRKAVTLILLMTAVSSYADSKSAIDAVCVEIGNTLGSVSSQDCLDHNFYSQADSALNRPILLKEYPPLKSRKPLGKVLLMGGIHGDEYSSVSLLFKWLSKLDRYHSGLFHWHVAPLLNPDGLLNGKATRQNANGVDLNRNFPTHDWDELALQYWRERTYENVRRYPGPTSASELETQWFIKHIEEFKPDAIIAVHAPHHLVDFDGPHSPPKRLGNLHLRLLGTYPGSLGNYGSTVLNIPVVTVELASAGIMPSNKEISKIWVDLVRWLKNEVPKQRRASSLKNGNASSQD